MALLFAGLYGPFDVAPCIGKLSVFISVHQFEEIFSALIDSAVDMPDKLSSEDYFFFLCVRLLNRGTHRYWYSDGSQRRPGHCACLRAGTERSAIAGIQGGQ